MIERRGIDAALREQNFRLSGGMGGGSAVSIGTFPDAAVGIADSVNGTGIRKRLVLKALDALSAKIPAMPSKGCKNAFDSQNAQGIEAEIPQIPAEVEELERIARFPVRSAGNAPVLQKSAVL